MNEWTVARNERTSLYEIHAKGCKHLMAKHLESCYNAKAMSGVEVAAEFERENEGCLAYLGPCAR